jgi:hypothetical protein
MARMTALEREMGAHKVDLLLLRPTGDIAESHRMQSWEVWGRVGEIVGEFRKRRGWTPVLRVRFLADPKRNAQYLLPEAWR